MHGKPDLSRHNLFQTTCTITGKICKVIVDGGSTDNFISKESVSKLQLKTERQPEPYKLSWLKKGDQVVVNDRCLVPLLIRKKYTDQVWCDVIIMDACHILLERPRQFDQKTTHDDWRNTYSFQMCDAKIALAPMKDSREPAIKRVTDKPKPNLEEGKSETKVRSSLLSMSSFLKEVEETQELYALVSTIGINDNSTPVVVEPLLQEFKELFPKELPPGLSPMRDIQHHIDLIPRASLPNRPTYRMSPTENEEMR